MTRGAVLVVVGVLGLPAIAAAQDKPAPTPPVPALVKIVPDVAERGAAVRRHDVEPRAAPGLVLFELWPAGLEDDLRAVRSRRDERVIPKGRLDGERHRSAAGEPARRVEHLQPVTALAVEVDDGGVGAFAGRQEQERRHALGAAVWLLAGGWAHFAPA